MSMAVILRNREPILLKTPQPLKFIIEVVEYHHSRMALQHIKDGRVSPRIVIDDPSEQITQPSCVLHRLILPRIKPSLRDLRI